MDMVRSRAAASSIASGIPSSARQTRAIVASVLVSEARSLRTSPGPVPQQLNGR